MQNRRNSLLPDYRDARPEAEQIDHRHASEAGSEHDAIARRRACRPRANLIHSLAAAGRERCQLRGSACACVLLFVLSGLASAQVDRTDNQFWSDVQVAVPIRTNIYFNVLGT